MSDPQLQEKAQEAAAEMNLELSRTTRLEVARILVRRMTEAMQRVRGLEAS